eukprot:CAMPEP_0174704400 /NCGR_PEP_ID=MMETSP1094-20130205/8007_1 /TAXON_ID=156173 /ORGANISM="Chrysochromulina brevifilum, Strain UTEX LB 985" /LENGTH=256 /DNA_ID=CAMNT_0015902449 /DNA_START=18 /DNA_END=788 /DNA_ORIENTATION=+
MQTLASELLHEAGLRVANDSHRAEKGLHADRPVVQVDVPTFQEGPHRIRTDTPHWAAQGSEKDDPSWSDYMNDRRKGPDRASQALFDALQSPAGKEQLRELWTTLDSDSNGVVSAKEWGRGVQRNQAAMSRYFGGMTLEEIGKAFRRLDTDGSGDLSWQEFEAGVAFMDVADRLTYALQSKEGAAELQALFHALDRDGNGRVSGKEWGQAVSKNKVLMSRYFGGSSLRAIGRMFSRLDVDGSGDLSWEEFVAMRHL